MCVYKRFEILKPGLGRQSQRIPQLFKKKGVEDRPRDEIREESR